MDYYTIQSLNSLRVAIPILDNFHVLLKIQLGVKRNRVSSILSKKVPDQKLETIRLSNKVRNLITICFKGLPPMPSRCAMQMRSHLEIKCLNGELNDMEKLMNDDNNVSSAIGSSNIYWLQLYSVKTGLLIRNLSSLNAHFNIPGLDPNIKFKVFQLFVIWSSERNWKLNQSN